MDNASPTLPAAIGMPVLPIRHILIGRFGHVGLLDLDPQAGAIGQPDVTLLDYHVVIHIFVEHVDVVGRTFLDQEIVHHTVSNERSGSA